jgi:lipopolysaccharide transport system permease protein
MNSSITAETPRPERHTMELRSHRSLRLTWELLVMVTWREIAIKYKQSVMGFFWALLMPCLIVMAGLIVRLGVSRMSGTALATDAMAAIMVKSLPWAFFVTAIRFSTNSLTANSNLVTRANCPRIVFPLASILSALFDMAIASIPLVIMLFVVGVKVGPQLLWVPVLLVMMMMLVSGLGVLLSTANLFYRDVKYIVEVLLMFGIFFTPVIYEADMLGEWRPWVMLNPMSPILEGLYKVVVTAGQPDLLWTAYSAAASLIIAMVAVLVFRRLEPSFADNI